MQETWVQCLGPGRFFEGKVAAHCSGQPTALPSCLETIDVRSLVSYCPWGHKVELLVIEQQKAEGEIPWMSVT